MNSIPWWGYVVLAGLSWGTYVPIIFYGGSELGGKANARLMAILCVGLAYFVIGVLFPLFLFLSGQQEWPSFKTTGLVFACMAGIAGAVGAICVVFASSAAMKAGLDQKLVNPSFNPATYRLYIAPLIFGLAPLINTLVASVWHPQPGHPFHFGFTPPSWKLVLGILLLAAGVFLILYSKEASETKKPTPAPVPASAPTPAQPEATPAPDTPS